MDFIALSSNRQASYTGTATSKPATHVRKAGRFVRDSAAFGQTRVLE
jgi:hypothetical protein